MSEQDDVSEVVVTGDGEVPPVLASDLVRHGIDVRLTEPHVRLVEQTVASEAVEVTLADTDGSTATVRAAYLVDSGGVRRDGRALGLSRDRPEDAHNLAWKLAAVLRGAGPDLLDTYPTERAHAPEHYRESRLSQHLGGQKPRIRAGDRLPDLVLRSVAGEEDVRLGSLLRRPVWTLLGFGSVTGEPLAAVRARFGPERVQTYVIGGGASRSTQVTLLDRYGEVSRRLAKRGGTVFAVRPDGFLGLCCGANADVLGAYLEDLLPAG